MKSKLRCLVPLAALCLAACGPNLGPAPPVAATPPAGPVNGVSWSYQDTYDAINWYFGPYGQHAVDCANLYDNRESGHWPYSDNGTHHGTFQLGQGFWGSIVAHAVALGRVPSWYDPWLNAAAAADAYGTSGWSAWRPYISGCR